MDATKARRNRMTSIATGLIPSFDLRTEGSWLLSLMTFDRCGAPVLSAAPAFHSPRLVVVSTLVWRPNVC